MICLLIKDSFFNLFPLSLLQGYNIREVFQIPLPISFAVGGFTVRDIRLPNVRYLQISLSFFRTVSLDCTGLSLSDGYCKVPQIQIIVAWVGQGTIQQCLPAPPGTGWDVLHLAWSASPGLRPLFPSCWEGRQLQACCLVPPWELPWAGAAGLRRLADTGLKA